MAGYHQLNSQGINNMSIAEQLKKFGIDAYLEDGDEIELQYIIQQVDALEDTKISMQRWIDYHNERADKADALVAKQQAALAVARNIFEYHGLTNAIQMIDEALK